MLSIKEAKYVGKYSIQLAFNNGKVGIANLEKTIFSDTRGIFTQLKDKSNFKDFKIEHSTVLWLNELDMAPEYLYFLAFRKNSELQEQFKKWGYIA
jgi:hypothetical protein